MIAVEEQKLRSLWDETRDLVGAAVDRLDSPPSPLRFFRDYVSQNKPCLISAAASHWPAISLWSHDSYLSHTMLSRSVSLHLTPDGRADALAPNPNHNPQLLFASAFVDRVPFPDALRLVVSSGSKDSPFVAYAQEQNDCFRSEYAPLAGDVEPHVGWATEALGFLPEAVNLWIGNGRSETSFHKDHYENIYVVVSGEKHFILLPPTEVHRLYVRSYPAARYSAFDRETGELKLEVEDRNVPWSSINPYPSSIERAASSFPLYFNGPKPYHCTVKAGDILYLPSMWFHHVRQTPDSSGRVIAVNYWYDMQFDIKYAYFNFMQSISPIPQDDNAEDDRPLSSR